MHIHDMHVSRPFLANGLSIREFTTPSFPVYMYDANGSYKLKTMGEVGLLLIVYVKLELIGPPSYCPIHSVRVTCLGTDLH